MKTEQRLVCAARENCTPEAIRASMTDEELEEAIRRIKESAEIIAAEEQKKREKDDLKVTQLMAELNKMTKLIPEEEIDLQEVFKEAEAYYKAIPMFDWGARENSNEHDMSKKYGSRITNAIGKCQRDEERIPKGLIADMHRIHEGKPPLHYPQRKKEKAAVRPTEESHKPTRSQAKWDETRERRGLQPKQYRNGHYSTVKAGFFNAVRRSRHLQNPTTLLLYLLQHRAWEGKRDKHDTYNSWYVKRKLIVASVGVEKICADLGVSDKTVRNWTNALHKSGVIKKLKEGLENVYVLGEIVGNKDLFYYSGEISWNSKPGPLH